MNSAVPSNSKHGHRTQPDPNETGMPSGIPYIIGNELAERFSFYGMRGILTIFMTRYLFDAAGEPANMSPEEAKSVYHLFTAGAYFFPLLGAMIADIVLGKYLTILFISLMYCVGHGMLALMDFESIRGIWGMSPLLFAGLFLIAIGAGGIKPCVSAHVGDQFGAGNKNLLTKIFNWFYFAINLGAAASNILTPLLLAKVGPWAAFGLPGILMAIATLLFWIGRNKFVHVPPSGWKKFKEETFGPAGRRAIYNLAPLFLIFVPVFWAIFDQTGSAWVLQSESMNRTFMGFTWLESQIQLVNPVLILTLIPVFTYWVYPAMAVFFEPTPLRKIGFGFLLTAASFTVAALIETNLTDQNDSVIAAIVADVPKSMGSVEPEGDRELDVESLNALVNAPPKKLSEVMKALREANWPQSKINSYVSGMPNIGWQFFAYLLLTGGEILVSIVCLEFAYTQSPPRMKSFIMGIYFLGVTFGNLFVSALNYVLKLLQREDGTTLLDGASYYWFFTVLMLVTLVVYVFFAMRYQGETYIQGETSEV